MTYPGVLKSTTDAEIGTDLTMGRLKPNQMSILQPLQVMNTFMCNNFNKDLEISISASTIVVPE
jgi:hypothetical protein